jgi:hypothetical protein
MRLPTPPHAGDVRIRTQVTGKAYVSSVALRLDRDCHSFKNAGGNGTFVLKKVKYGTEISAQNVSFVSNCALDVI